MQDQLIKAIEMRINGQLDESNSILIKLAVEYPKDPIVQYQCAWSYDVLSKEKEAVAHYEMAIEKGLSGTNLQEAFLGLGSTYRTLGKYNKSKETLKKGIDKFPEARALKVFYAMTLYNLGDNSDAMEILLTQLAETSNDKGIQSYDKSIKYYADQLDRVW